MNGIFEIIFIIIYLCVMIYLSATGKIRWRRSIWDRLFFSDFGNTYGETNIELMESRRNFYETRLREYLSNNKVKNYLVNTHCVLMFYKLTNGDSYFYCKERGEKGKQGRMFYVTGQDEHTATMWSIMNMEFNQSATYSSFRTAYINVNGGANVVGGMKYFKEDTRVRTPEAVTNKFAQNEYCIMQIKHDNNEVFIECHEIWSKDGEPKSIIIRGDKYQLYVLIGEFAKRKNKKEDIYAIYQSYKKNKNYSLEFLSPKNGEITQKFGHAENTEKMQINDNSTQIQQKENAEQKENITRFNERNLDL